MDVLNSIMPIGGSRPGGVTVDQALLGLDLRVCLCFR